MPAPGTRSRERGFIFLSNCWSPVCFFGSGVVHFTPLITLAFFMFFFIFCPDQSVPVNNGQVPRFSEDNDQVTKHKFSFSRPANNLTQLRTIAIGSGQTSPAPSASLYTLNNSDRLGSLMFNSIPQRHQSHKPIPS